MSHQKIELLQDQAFNQLKAALTESSGPTGKIAQTLSTLHAQSVEDDVDWGGVLRPVLSRLQTVKLDSDAERRLSTAAKRAIAASPDPDVHEVLTRIGETGRTIALTRLPTRPGAAEDVVAGLGALSDELVGQGHPREHQDVAERSDSPATTLAENMRAAEEKAWSDTAPRRAPVDKKEKQPQVEVSAPVQMQHTNALERPGFEYPELSLMATEDGDTIIATLFEKPEGDALKARGPQPGLIRLVQALPPPPDPEISSGEIIAQWFRGEIWDEDSWSIEAGLLTSAPEGDQMEVESELYSSPASSLQAYRARKPLKTDQDGAGWCRRMGRDLQAYGTTIEKAVLIFAEKYKRTLEEKLGSEALAALKWGGARLHVSQELAFALGSFLDIEAEFKRDGPKTNGEGDQDPRGSFHPDRDLQSPCCLNRAFFLHEEGGLSLGDAMREALIELRYAQVLHAAGGHAVPHFDAVFKTDPGYYFSELLEQLGITEEEKKPEQTPAPF